MNIDFAAIFARVQRLILSPAAEWEVIAGEPADMQKIYMSYVGPLVVASALAAAVGQILFGFGIGFGLRQLLMSIVLGLIGVYVFAFVVNVLAPQFGGTANMGQAFKVAAYFPTAAWVGGLFAAIPAISFISILGALYSLYLLYVGLPKLMRPSDDKALVYLGSVVGAVIVIYLAAYLMSSSMMPSMTPLTRNY